MSLREQYRIETGKCCALDRRRECNDDRVFSEEYVEWLENKVKSNMVNNQSQQ